MSLDRIKLLIVDDDISLLKMMQQMMELEGYEIITAMTGASAIKIFESNTPDLVLLDAMLPDMDGIVVCKSIRRFSKVPIIMVTGKSDINYKIEGFYSGADDYITKPFSYRELVARVIAVLRRTTIPKDESNQPEFNCNGLKIDFARQLVTIDDERVDLSATEYRVLTYLAIRAGKIVNSREILQDVWGDKYSDSTHMLQVNVSRIRQKIKDDARNYKYIETKPGIGYILNTQEMSQRIG